MALKNEGIDLDDDSNESWVNNEEAVIQVAYSNSGMAKQMGTGSTNKRQSLHRTIGTSTDQMGSIQTNTMVMQLRTDNQRMRLVLQQLQTEVGTLRNDMDRVKTFIQERHHIPRRFRGNRRLYSGRVGSNQQFLPEEWDNVLVTPSNMFSYGSSGRVTANAGDLL